MSGGLGPLIVLAAFGLVVAVPLLVYGLVGTRDPARRAARENLLAPESLAGAPTLLQAAGPAREFGPFDLALQGAVRRFAPDGVVAAARTRVQTAGISRDWPAERLVAAKVLLSVVLLIVGILAVRSDPSPTNLVALVVAPLAGFKLPDVRVGGLAKKRQEGILLSLADTLDLMTVTVEAGIGFEAAMVRAGRSSSGPLAEELVRTMQEMQIGVPRPQALTSMAERCGVPDVTTFTTAIVQAERYGVPIARVLRVQSSELREKRRQRAEETAMKIPAKVILPLALCILPAMMILVVGPAIVSIARSFAQL